MIPVFRNKYLRAWPKYEAGEPLEYLPLADALAREYPDDAHFACYSLPELPRRLSVEAAKQRDVVMVAVAFDVDGAAHKVSPEWLAAEQSKIDALLAAHPVFVYRTRGGYRIVGELPEPIPVAGWAHTYMSWVRYLARRFSIKADPLKDWPRLFRLPHTVRDGELQQLETWGAPGLWQPELAPEDAEQLTQRDANTLAVRLQSAPGLLTELFRARGWLGDPNSEGVNVRCPRHHEHSGGAPEPWAPSDTSTALFPADDVAKYGRLKCLHTNCRHDQLTARDWLAHFSPQEILEATERLSGSWWGGLIMTSQGVMPCGANMAHVLEHHPDWSGKLSYDLFADRPLLSGQPLRDEDVTTISHWAAKNLQFEPGADKAYAAIVVVARKNAIHPLQAYLEGVTWDRTPRLDRMLHTHFTAADTPWTRAVGSKWMLSAVARAFEPGCKADCMLVLEAKQGTRKSTGLKALCPLEAWFGDSALPIGEKDAYVVLRNKWIYEVAELNALKGRDITWIKAFLSAPSDYYRAPYERLAKDHPRQGVFAGSTNEAEYLEDRTGGRRFWPVECLGVVDTDAIARDRDQLWAEAVWRYASGEAWHLDTLELSHLAEEEQEARTIRDDWVDLIHTWLTRETVWEKNVKTTRPRNLPNGVTTGEVLVGALGFEADRITKAASTRCGCCLRELGWQAKQLREQGGRTRRYYPCHNRHNCPNHL
jgi:hypothetical protein